MFLRLFSLIYCITVFCLPLSNAHDDRDPSVEVDGMIQNQKPYLFDFVEAGIEENIYFANPNRFDLDVATKIAAHIGVELKLGKLISAKLWEVFEKQPLLEFFIKRKIFQYEWKIAPVLNTKKSQKVILAARNGFYITLNSDYWNSLDPNNKVGLIFHEAIYTLSEFYSNYAHYSYAVRNVNATIFHSNFASISTERLNAILDRNGFRVNKIVLNTPYINNQLIILRGINGYERLNGTQFFAISRYNQADDDYGFWVRNIEEKINDFQITLETWGLGFGTSTCTYSTCRFIKNGTFWTNETEMQQFFSDLKSNKQPDYKFYEHSDMFW